jgi:hypothetical protein
MEQHVNKLGAMIKEIDDIGAVIPDEIKVMVSSHELAKKLLVI